MSLDAIPFLSPEELAAFLAMPAHEGPYEGYIAQLDNPPNNNGLAHAAIAVCTTFVILCFVIRIYARVFRLRKVEIEDGLMLVAFGFLVAFLYEMYQMMDLTGFFVHQWDITFGTLNDLTYILHIGGSCYTVTLACLKAAILLEWSRVFVPLGSRTAFWWICNAMALAQGGFMIATVVAMQLGCSPINRNWDFTVKGTCHYPKKNLEIATATISLAFDVVILILPQRVIWKLQMSVRQKVSVSVIFGVGVLACVAACFRLVVTLRYTASTDVVFHVAPLALWTLAECTCGFLVFCVPSAPKALTDTGVFSRVKATMRSWSGMGPSSAKSGGSGSLTGGSGAGTHTPGVTSRVHASRANDEYLPIQDGDGGVVLAKFSESTEELRAKHDGAIIKTTRFTTREDFVDASELDERPWNRRHRGDV